MTMRGFFHAFPQLSEADLRLVRIGHNRAGVPADLYAFGELYCDEPGCDCRRVIVLVTPGRTRTPVAAIALGFDSDGDLAGPYLEPWYHQEPYAPALLGLFTESINGDPAYLAGLQRHYALFKGRCDGRPYAGPSFETPGRVKRVARVERPRRSPPDLGSPPPVIGPVRRGVKLGRNDPCPCGSGKKRKQCCTDGLR